MEHQGLVIARFDASGDARWVTAFGAIAMQLTKVDPEMPRGERYGHAKRVGAGAAKARLVSIVVKGGIALAMGVVFIWSMAT